MDGQQHWNAEDYAHHARFVADLARPLIGMLDPKPGEMILDLACGDGVLTAEIYRSGAKIIEIDRAEARAEAVLSVGAEHYRKLQFSQLVERPRAGSRRQEGRGVSGITRAPEIAKDTGPK